MKLTLFTISNEQIKEQLSKLQTKVESLETVKDVQDKIISAKDSQISFLNDQIGNILSFVGIITGVVIFAFGYVAWLNKQAQNKVEQAEGLISQNQETATIAQEKLHELEEKQIELNTLAKMLNANQQIDMTFRRMKQELDLVDTSITTILDSMSERPMSSREKIYGKIDYYTKRKLILLDEYIDLSLKFNDHIINNKEISAEKKDKTHNLQLQCHKLYEEFNRFEKSL
ncbi:putative spbB protein [Bacillus mycoides]|uniref:hypothetical protein n=1 Tax=Bacillus mycoides TaxID=1405 RepID=UPI0001A046DD|nr:hypothetical protein [Bacillus mycoides]AIW84406.1 putative spbB protein [Bacillus mycoides]EEL05470.1 spbB protein [Bacillus cereus BDRD-ST196]GAE42465.1 hypothetical protein BW1_066_01150 [Bacillus mycoides NBRC 101238 = DSM 11821]HDR7596061.1 hypothetical protein [Bacillus mycoides]